MQHGSKRGLRDPVRQCVQHGPGPGVHNSSGPGQGDSLIIFSSNFQGINYGEGDYSGDGEGNYGSNVDRIECAGQGADTAGRRGAARPTDTAD